MKLETFIVFSEILNWAPSSPLKSFSLVHFNVPSLSLPLKSAVFTTILLVSAPFVKVKSSDITSLKTELSFNGTVVEPDSILLDIDLNASFSSAASSAFL